MASADTWLADCERNFALKELGGNGFTKAGKNYFFPNSFHPYKAKGEASDEVEPPGVNLFSMDGETPEERADRVYQELREQHVRSGGPTQRMKDAVAFYNRTVKVDG